MRLVYINHSGFALEAERCSVVMDFFKDVEFERGSVCDRLLRREVPIYVLASHFHSDHFNPEVLRWRELRSDIHYIFSKDILRRRKAKTDEATYLRKGDSYADDCLAVKAFGSTDVGVSFRLDIEGQCIFHAGDLNNWHWQDESTPREVKEAEGNFLAELALIAQETPAIDLAMFPVDPRMGSDFARGACQFVRRIKTRRFVPMHFWERPDEVRDLTDYMTSQGCRYVLLDKPGEMFEW